MKNKILSILIIVTLALSASLFPMNTSAEDIGSSTGFASDILKSICPEVVYKAEGYYTRAEFTASVIELLGTTGTTSATYSFTDVPSDHPYASQIAHAVNLGLINDGTEFNPDSAITYTQATKIATSAIGYGHRAELMGGYPTGYLRSANDSGIADYLPSLKEEAMSYADGIIMLYNMVVADIVEVTGYGDTHEYTRTEGRNILSVYHDIFTLDGIVEATEYTGLYSKNKTCGKGKILINGTEYQKDDTYGLIGQNVKVFYKDDAKRTVVYAHPIYVSIKKFDTSFDLSISGTRLTAVPETGNEKTYKLYSGYAVIYNGKNLAAADFNPYLNPQSGSITLIDNNDDDAYDVIYIEDISYGVIDRINLLEKKIYDKYKSNGVIDLSDTDSAVFAYDASGNKISLSGILPGSAVGYIMSKDSKLLKICVYDGVYGGRIAGKTSDGMLKIKDKYFELSNYYTANIRTYDKVKLGSEVICYLGEGDIIVYMEDVSKKMDYGFLVARGGIDGLEGKLVLKIMSSVDGMITADIAPKVNINGSIRNMQEAKTDIDDIISMEDKYRIIKFSLNSDGLVNKIYSAVDAADATTIFDPIDDESRPKAYVTHRCYYTGGLFTPYFAVDISTNFLMVPESANEKASDDNFDILTMSSLKDASSYDIVAYDVDNGGVSNFVMIYKTASLTTVSESSPTAVIEKVYTTIDEDGDVVECIKGYVGRQYILLYANESTPPEERAKLATLDAGDIIRINYDSKNIIKALALDFDYSTKTCYPHANAPTNHDSYYYHFIRGPIYSISGTYAIIADEAANLNSPLAITDTTSVNLKRGKTVFVRINRDRNGTITDAVVYTEDDFSSVESWFSAGNNADYFFSRQRFYGEATNIIYVN